MAARLTVKAVNDELARLGHQARPGRPHYVALACVLGGGVARTSVTAFLVAACFSAALAGAMRPARFPGTFFTDGLDVVGALAAVLAFLAAAHLALCAATIWARPFGLNFHFFTTRAAAAGEEAAGPTEMRKFVHMLQKSARPKRKLRLERRWNSTPPYRTL